MEPWIPITIAAATAQTLRFMVQRHLKATSLSTGGATFSRFVFSAPIVAVLILAYGALSERPLPGLNPEFFAFAVWGGTAQILATMCVIALFTHRNFAVGITFKKTETVQTAIVGSLVLGEGVSRGGAVAIGIGLGGVLLLSDPPGGQGRWLRRIWNRASGLGLASGVLFACSAVGYRGASLALDGGDAVMRAGTTLAVVTTLQSLALGAWLAWREPGQLTAVVRVWRIAALAGITSMIGSFCWFLAFTLQNAAYVKALGQIELIFSVLVSVLIFRERITAREIAGMALLTLSILVLILAL
ncbi:DMT family transporter [Rhodobacteraceae bacterium CCMM004]|nr:DMT family transporter [Rhodobacteraceae bacterium CCMM004]